MYRLVLFANSRLLLSLLSLWALYPQIVAGKGDAPTFFSLSADLAAVKQFNGEYGPLFAAAKAGLLTDKRGGETGSVAMFAPPVLIANYPLITNLSSTVGTWPDVFLDGDPTPPTPPTLGHPLCQNGIYLYSAPGGGGQNIWFPQFYSQLNFSNFSFEIDFRLAGYPSSYPSFPPVEYAPIIMGGGSSRWLGVSISASGLLMIKYNNSNHVFSDTYVDLHQWYTAKVVYNAGIVALYLDGCPVLIEEIGALSSSSDRNFVTTDFSNGKALNGCIRNFRLYNGGDAVNTDPTPPSITCPGNTTIVAGAGCTASLGSYAPVSVSDNCVANPTVTQTPAATTLLSGHNDVETVRLTARDGIGNTAFCTFTVTLLDRNAPTITCPANTIITADADCSVALGSYAPVSVSDNCVANPTVTQTPAATTLLSGHNDVETVRLTASDGNGNSDYCTFTVTLKDQTQPTITCPANTTIFADADCSVFVGAYTAVSVADNCTASPTVTQSPPAATPISGHNASRLVQLTANDGNGNIASCTFTVTLQDQTQPTITCPANATIVADADCTVSLGAYTAVSVADNCTANPAVTQSPAAATPLSGHNDVETVTLTADDGNGNTAFCTFTVTLRDQTQPTITCPANATILADGDCSVPLGAYAAVSAADNCTANPTVTQSPSAATLLSGHNDVETVTLTADDGNGNIAFCTFTVTLRDQTQPTITCPTNTTILADADCDVPLGSYTAVSVADNCTANPAVTQSPSASTLLSGHNDVETVTLTADDGNGNTASCTFTVTLKDQTQPTITCPANAIIVADGDCTVPLGSYMAVSAADNCTATPTVTQSPAAATLLSGHNDVETVTLTADDGNGNTASCTFTVTLKDQIKPTITCPANTIVAAGPSCTAPLGSYAAASVADNCMAGPAVTQSPSSATLLSGHNDLKTVTLTADDGNGNTASCTFTVTLKDQTQPTITCPANTIVAAGPSCTAPLGSYAAASVADNCTASPAVTQSPSAATVLSGHNDSETVTLTANDGNGNTASCTFTVTLRDQAPPMVSCSGGTLTFGGEASFPVTSVVTVQSGDNCGVGSTSYSPQLITCDQVGDNVPVVVTVTDINGNVSRCTTSVQVSGLPCGFENTDIGCSSQSSYNAATGVFTLQTNGCANANPSSDQLGFIHQELCGNGSISFRVASVSPSTAFAGITLRASAAPGAIKAEVVTNLGYTARGAVREYAGAAAWPSPLFFYGRQWLKLERWGNQVRVYTSTNGQSWTILMVRNLTLPQCVQVGMVAYGAGAVTATFDNMVVNGSGLLVAPSPGMIATDASDFPLPTSDFRQAPLPSPRGRETGPLQTGGGGFSSLEDASGPSTVYRLSFTVYPNPTSGAITVQLPAELSLEGAVLDVLDGYGRSLRREARLDYRHRLDLSDLPSGAYFLRLQTGDGRRMIERVVVVRP